MEAVLYYLLKVSIATIVFYGTYYFLFRKTKQFVFNRIYLAGSFLAAFIIPMITFQTTSQISKASTYISGNVGTDVLLPVTTGTATGTHSIITTFLFGLYLCGVLYFLIKLIYGYTVAAGIRNSCTRKNVGDLEVLVSEGDNRAFTFFDKIIIGKNLLNHPALEMVLKHEAVHSREQHFYDIILAEIFLLLQWFNPFARFHAQAIRNNLEFRADDVVIQTSDKQGYQMTMLGMALNSINSALFTALNSSNLKKRIVMMNSKNQNQSTALVRWAIVPVLALLLVSLSGKKAVTISEGGSESEQSSQLMQENPSDPIHSVEELMKYLSENLNYPAEARAGVLIGTARIYARVNPDGSIREVMDVKPEEDSVEFDEMVIIGYTNDGSEELKKTKSYRHQSLLAEGKRVIDSLPKLEITDLQGKLIQFNFRFDMYTTNKRSGTWVPRIDQETLNAIVK